MRSAAENQAWQTTEQMIFAAFPMQPVPALPLVVETNEQRDAARVELFYQGQTWGDKIGQLEGRAEVFDSFIFLRAHARRYYLPAFMVTLGRSWPHRDLGTAAEALCSVLTNPSRKEFFNPELNQQAAQGGKYDDILRRLRENLQDQPYALQRVDQNFMQAPGAVVAQIQAAWDDFIRGFSAPQMCAIRAFLAFMLEFHSEDFGAEIALIATGL